MNQSIHKTPKLSNNWRHYVNKRGKLIASFIIQVEINIGKLIRRKIMTHGFSIIELQLSPSSGLMVTSTTIIFTLTLIGNLSTYLPFIYS